VSSKSERTPIDIIPDLEAFISELSIKETKPRFAMQSLNSEQKTVPSEMYSDSLAPLLELIATIWDVEIVVLATIQIQQSLLDSISSGWLFHNTVSNTSLPKNLTFPFSLTKKRDQESNLHIFSKPGTETKASCKYPSYPNVAPSPLWPESYHPSST
jgi:hypothetical protein